MLECLIPRAVSSRLAVAAVCRDAFSSVPHPAAIAYDGGAVGLLWLSGKWLVHINVICPGCDSTYQVDEWLRGRKMRCPNPQCREVFEVRTAEVPPPKATSAASEPAPVRRPLGPVVPPSAIQESGAVGDLVPILPAEKATSSEPPSAKSSAWLADDVPLVPIEEEAAQDEVPLLPAEEVEVLEVVEEEPAPPSRPASWRQAPPPRRTAKPTGRHPPASTQTTRKPKPPRPEQQPLPPVPNRPPTEPAAAETQTAAEGLPLELPPGMWEPPPVRRGIDAPPAAEQFEPVPDETPKWETPAPQARRRRAGWLMAGISLTAVAVVAASVWIAFTIFTKSEAELREQARLDFQEHRYRDANGRYRNLAEKFPDSADLAEYQLMARLSDLSGNLQAIGANHPVVLEEVSAFLARNGKEPLLKQHADHVGKGLVRLLSDHAASVGTSGNKDSLATLDRGQQVLDDLLKRFPDSTSAAERAKVAASVQVARNEVSKREKYQQLLAQLEAFVKAPSADAIKEAHRLLRQESAERPELAGDPKVIQLLAQLYEGHRDSIVRIPANGQGADPAPRIREQVEPGLLVDQLVAGRPVAQPEDERLVLALVRGVLYGLAQDTGAVRWATRVGIDTSTLPVRVPATLVHPEMFLVLSADTTTLTAIDTSGTPCWRAPYRLSAPCLGRPVIVDQRAFVPTYDGQVHEIELAHGQPLGRYRLGQRLSFGGVRQPGTQLLYFAADDLCVYVLNVDPRLPPDRRRCEAVLYSGHPSGSLRSEPILASWGEHPDAPADPGMPQGYLILSQTNSLDSMELRVFGLPLTDPHSRPLSIQPRPQTRGWTWFSPYHDPEKLALATDAGVLSLFGIRQPGNDDLPLFSILGDDVHLGGTRNETAHHRGRAQVVHVQENDYWVLAQGRLQRWQLTFDRKAGPKMTAVWKEPPALGSPLHTGQVTELSGGGLGLLLVTQSQTRQTCFATLVNAEDGRIIWQRQLGLVCQSEPLQLGQEVLAVDQGGGLFRFDPRRQPNRPDLEWQIGGQSISRPLEDSSGTPPYLLSGPEGTAYEMVASGKGTDLVIRRLQPDKEGEKGSLTEHTLELRAPLAGAPALGAGGLLLPLADGSLRRLYLPLDNSPGVEGPDWRLTRAGLDQPAHVLWLNDQEFLTTDGSRGLNRWRWPKGGVWHAVPKSKDARTSALELSARIVSAPVLVPRDEPTAEAQVCAADAEGNLYLVQAKGDALQIVRRWTLGGKVTAGPFVRGKQIGCIVDRRRLVWLDPAAEKPLWAYTSVGEAIVGQPQRIDDQLVVADVSGRFVGLDPATGQPRGPGCVLRSSVAPAASPIAFGPGRMFAPLTDGTVLLLPLHRLLPRDPLRGMPGIW